MPLYRHYKQELVHIHIPKTGGTSITRACEQYGAIANFMTKRSFAQCGGVPPQHMDIRTTKTFFDLGKIPAFAVVRDPWHRTISEFVWRQQPLKWKFLNSFLKEMLINTDHARTQNHFLPQHKFVNKDVKLFRYESNWREMKEYIGDKLRFKNFDIIFREQARQRYEAPPIHAHIDSETKKLWEDLYKEDLELYHSL